MILLMLNSGRLWFVYVFINFDFLFNELNFLLMFFILYWFIVLVLVFGELDVIMLFGLK